MEKIVNLLESGVADKEYIKDTLKWVYFFDGVAVASDAFIYLELETGAAKMCAVNINDTSHPKGLVSDLVKENNDILFMGYAAPDFATMRNYYEREPEKTGKIDVLATLSEIQGYDVVGVAGSHFLTKNLVRILKVAKKLKIKELDFSFYSKFHANKFTATGFYSLSMPILVDFIETTDFKIIEI